MVDIPTTEHNEALSGDTLYSAFLNYQWREIVMPYIISGMKELESTIEDETERQDFWVRYGAMIEDFYDEDVMLSQPLSVTLQRNTDQSIAANTATPISWNDVISSQGATMWTVGVPTKVIIPVDYEGFYLITGNVFFPATATAVIKSARIVVNNLTIYQSAVTILQQVSVVCGFGLVLDEGDEIEIDAFCSTALAVQGDSNGLTTITVVRIPTQP